MQHFIRENTDRFRVTVHGGGVAVDIHDRLYSASAKLSGDDADDFIDALDKMERDRVDPGSIWFNATWNDCLSHISDDYLAAADQDYADWREAAKAHGWDFVETDPSPDADREGPCLHNSKHDRVMPLGYWEEAVRDLGYASPQEAMEEFAEPSLG